MNKKQLSFRRAELSDTTLITDLGARTFQASFAADNTAEDMADYLMANFSKERIQEQLSDPASTFLLAYEQGQVVGYAMLYAGETPDQVNGPSPIELVRIYVETDIIGRGYGSALLKACLDEAIKRGHETVWLGVWERNQRAIRFYEKWGFNKVGDKKFVLGSDVQNDFIMVRPLIIGP